MKKLYFGSNLKMYKGISATREYLQKLVENTKDISRDEIELFTFRLIRRFRLQQAAVTVNL